MFYISIELSYLCELHMLWPYSLMCNVSWQGLFHVPIRPSPPASPAPPIAGFDNTSDWASEASLTQHFYIFVLKMDPGVVRHWYLSNPAAEKEARPFTSPLTPHDVGVEEIDCIPFPENAVLGAGDTDDVSDSAA